MLAIKILNKSEKNFFFSKQISAIILNDLFNVIIFNINNNNNLYYLLSGNLIMCVSAIGEGAVKK